MFCLYHQGEPKRFSDLEKAVACAEELVTDLATRLAQEAGAESIEISLSRSDNHIKHDIDGELFLDCEITATASGRPDCNVLDLPESPEACSA